MTRMNQSVTRMTGPAAALANDQDPVTTWLNRRVLVTGATGFIGTHLCHRLCQLGAQVHGLTRDASHLTNNGITWWQGELSDISQLRQTTSEIQPELIIHLAGLTSAARQREHVLPTLHGNLVNTVNLLTAASECGCRRLISAGSLEEPGEGDDFPTSPYAAAKWAAAGYAKMFHSLYDLETVVLRLFMVYGPAQPDERKLIPYVISSLLEGRTPKLSQGDRPVDWVYVDDVVDSFIAAGEARDVGGCSLDIGSGKLVTVRELVEQLAPMVDPNAAVEFGAIPDRPLERVRAARTARTAAFLSWRPKVRLREGLQRTVKWYQSQMRKGSGVVRMLCAFLLFAPCADLPLCERDSRASRAPLLLHYQACG